MTSKIDYILQIDGQNILQVVYRSGTSRIIPPDDCGHYEANMAKTQRDFIRNSQTVEMRDATGWGGSITYWLNRENPNMAILSAIKQREEAAL